MFFPSFMNFIFTGFLGETTLSLSQDLYCNAKNIGYRTEIAPVILLFMEHL